MFFIFFTTQFDTLIKLLTDPEDIKTLVLCTGTIGAPVRNDIRGRRNLNCCIEYKIHSVYVPVCASRLNAKRLASGGKWNTYT
jgi:hypothetical protein